MNVFQYLDANELIIRQNCREKVKPVKVCGSDADSTVGPKIRKQKMSY